MDTETYFAVQVKSPEYGWTELSNFGSDLEDVAVSGAEIMHEKPFPARVVRVITTTYVDETTVWEGE